MAMSWLSTKASIIKIILFSQIVANYLQFSNFKLVGLRAWCNRVLDIKIRNAKL